MDFNRLKLRIALHALTHPNPTFTKDEYRLLDVLIPINQDPFPDHVIKQAKKALQQSVRLSIFNANNGFYVFNADMTKVMPDVFIKVLKHFEEVIPLIVDAFPVEEEVPAKHKPKMPLYQTEMTPDKAAKYQHGLACLCERIQEDLVALLDGLDEDIIDNACQIVVDRFKEVL